MIPAPIAAAILIAAYALSDRFVGGGWPKLDAKLPGRSVFWATLVLVAVGWLLGGWPLAVLGLGWGLYRSLPFSGATTPISASELLRCAVRHGIIIPAAVFIAIGFDRSPWITAGAFTLYTLAAVGLAHAYGLAKERAVERGVPIDPALNARTELLRGAAFGLAASVAFVLSF